MRFRVPRELPRFKEVATRLVHRWPTKNGSLPQVGDYIMMTRNGSDTMFFNTGRPFGFLFREKFGHFIWRCEDGGLRFALLSRPDCFVEYHPKGMAPGSLAQSLPSDLSRREPFRAARLEDSWYLTQIRSP